MHTDEILVLQAMNGNLSSFEELINRYKKQVFAILYRMMGQYQEAEDVSQEVFFTVYQKLYQFDKRKKFAPWLYRITINMAINALRKKNNVIVVNFDENYTGQHDWDYNFHYLDPEQAFERKELHEEIEAAISELNDSYRAIIILRYQMDLSNAEIAEILGISKENVEVKVHRARRSLRKIILRKWEEREKADELPANQ